MKSIEAAFAVNPVTDLKRARDFYEGTLGLKSGTVYEGRGMSWVEYEVGSGVLAIGPGTEQFESSAEGGSVAVEMDDFEAAIGELKSSGCTFLVEPAENSTRRVAVILDPDGNTITIRKRNACG
jgi:catechol 2,3-dioxygenase-like lactoylglutathione lyase family enzyme